MRLSTTLLFKALLLYETVLPKFPLASPTATSAQFQNSSGADDLLVQELVVM
jgi:hypothetical protein